MMNDIVEGLTVKPSDFGHPLILHKYNTMFQIASVTFLATNV